MFNFAEIDFKRVIAHRIMPMKEDEDTASMIPSLNLLNIDDNIEFLIKSRLSKASINKSKFFAMAIENALESSVFGYSKDMIGVHDNYFIDYSKKIGEILAQSMTSAKLPGGLLILIEATDAPTGRNLILIIKAQMNQALNIESTNVSYLNNIFLSSDMRLFKFGMIIERYEEETDEETKELPFPNNKFAAFLYDTQFKYNAKPSIFFYKDFLGFDALTNPKVQTKVFYDSTEDFILSEVPDTNQRQELLKLLDVEVSNSAERYIEPKTFADTYFHDEELNNLYESNVAMYIPSLVEKDLTLIAPKLNSKKIFFPDNVKVTGPTDSMDKNVTMIKTQEELDRLRLDQNQYTIVKILGKPFNW